MHTCIFAKAHSNAVCKQRQTVGAEYLPVFVFSINGCLHQSVLGQVNHEV